MVSRTTRDISCLSMSQTRERDGFEFVISRVYPIYVTHLRATGLLGWSVCTKVICSCLTLPMTSGVSHVVPMIPCVITLTTGDICLEISQADVIVQPDIQGVGWRWSVQLLALVWPRFYYELDQTIMWLPTSFRSYVTFVPCRLLSI